MARKKHQSGETLYIRAADMPPLHPDERTKSLERLVKLHESINAQALQERREKLLSWAQFAP